MGKNEKVSFALGKAGMHMTLVLKSVKVGEEKTKIKENLSFVILDSPITNNEPVMHKTVAITENVVGIRHLDGNVFELETTNHFYEIMFIV